MSYLSVTYLFAIVIYFVVVQAAFDCLKRPKMNYKVVSDCCAIPKPNLRAFPAECAKYMKNYEKVTNLCILECFLMKTKTLENGVFNGVNAKPTLMKIFNDTSVVDAHILAFDKCTAIVNQSAKEFEANGVLKAATIGQKCSPLAVIFTMCVSKYVFINCPTNLWKSTSSCEKIKEYSKNCGLSPSGRSVKQTGF